jgi:ribosomal protein L7/L12
MPAKKPSLQEVMEAIQSLNVGMGAELVALRAEVEKQNQTIVGLSHMLAKDWITKTAESLVGTQPMTVGMPLFNTPDQIYNGAMPLNAPEKSMATGGFVIDAIKAYRIRIEKLTGTVPGLKASKDLVEAYIKGAPLKPAFNILSPPPLLESHKSFVKLGQKIEAIKAYREYTKEVCGGGYAGLKEAKDVIDAYAWSIDAANFNPSITFINSPF